MSKPRSVDSERQLLRLEQKHQSLKSRVQELDARLHLSAAEEAERQRLKKEKLAAKDQLKELRGESA